MARRPAGTGMKRQVSPAVAIVVILAVIGLALVIGLGGSVWHNFTGRKTSISDMGTPEEFQNPGDPKRVACERMGADIKPLPLSGSGSTGLPVLSVTPGAPTELQVGDIITAINGIEVKSSLGILTLTKETNKVKVGEPMKIDVLRNGQKTTVQVQRRASTPSSQGAGGRMGVGGMRPGMGR